MSGDNGSNDVNLLNSIFGYSVVSVSHSWNSTYLDSAAAAGTTFEGGPASISGLDATFGVDSTSLPSGALDLYSNGDFTSVMATSYGAGNVIFLAYDWWATSSDAGWGSVLDSGVTMAPVPEPATMLLLGSGLIGLAGFRRKKFKK